MDGVDSISLEGTWRFQLDPDDTGLHETWFDTPPEGVFEETIELPGTVQKSGLGPEITGLRRGRLSPRCLYTGPAWYQRTVIVPEAWAGKHISLFMERCNRKSTIWVDASPAGEHMSLSTPHIQDLSQFLTPGKHLLTIRVDNTREPFLGGTQAIAEDATTNWNGIIGRFELIARDPVHIDHMDVYPDVKTESARVKIVARNAGKTEAQGTVTVTATREGREAARVESPFAARPGISELSVELLFPNGMDLWDEFSPALYTVAAELASGTFRDRRELVTGMREFGVKGTQFLLNGNTVFLRGALDGSIFPITGHSEMRKEEWLRIMSVCKDHGLNHIRYHSNCPPEAAFAAADELGIIIQAENTLWYDPNFGAKPTGSDPARAALLKSELDAILRFYGHHPSFCLYSMGNELGPEPEPFQLELMERGEKQDKRHLYTRNSGYLDEDIAHDYYVTSKTSKGSVRAQSRFIEVPPNTTDDFSEPMSAVNRPIISHEVGEWNMMPHPAEEAKYTGVMRGGYIELYRQDLEKKGMAHLADDFFEATGNFMVSLYKEEVEMQLRTPGKAGFQLLGLQDYPAMGIALIGVTDAFWDPKGIIAPEAWRRFCAPAVPLLRMVKRVWTTDEHFLAEAEISNYRKEPLANVTPIWRIVTPAGETVASGEWDRMTIRAGGLQKVGLIDTPLSGLNSPGKYEVSVSVPEAGLENSWDIWVFPPPADVGSPANVTLAQSWDTARTALEEGARVILLPDLKLFHAIDGAFPPPMWSHAFYHGQAGTMGILCDPAHPALEGFPTEQHSDWQWWHLVQNSVAMMLDIAPAELRPLVRVIDNWDRLHRLATLFEARAGEGTLLVCTMDLLGEIRDRPEARQFRRSLFDYAASDAFDPQTRLEMATLDELFKPAPTYNTQQAPENMDDAVLNVLPADNVWSQGYPLGMLSFDGNHDTVVARTEGFGYTGQKTFQAKSLNAGIAGWRNLWFSYACKVEVTCPRGFTGKVYLRLLDRDQTGLPARVQFEGQDIPAGHYGGANGYWVALPVTAEASRDGTLDLEVWPGKDFIWITQLVVRPETA